MASEVERTNEEVKHNITNLLSSPNRDYLVRNNGDRVKVDELKGKIVGLYFSGSWCSPCQKFTPRLVEVYNQLLQQINKFEVVFVSWDKNDKKFADYFSKMPWLAIPFSDSDTRKLLEEVFSVDGVPHLVILDENGKVLTDEGADLIDEHGAEAYPFTTQHMDKLKKKQEGGEEEEEEDDDEEEVYEISVAELEVKTVKGKEAAGEGWTCECDGEKE